MWEKKTLIHCWWECKIGQSICKTVGRFHSNQKLKKKKEGKKEIYHIKPATPILRK